MDTLKDTRGRPRKLRLEEEVEVLAKQQMQATFKAKTSDKQENNLIVSKDADTAAAKEAGARGSLAINSLSSSQDAAGSTKSVRKSTRIEAAHDSIPVGSNPATVFAVPRPRARFAATGQSQNLGIVLADIRNYTTTASRVLGLGELEDIDFWDGAAAAYSSQIRTRVVARKGEDEEWDLEFGPDGAMYFTVGGRGTQADVLGRTEAYGRRGVRGRQARCLAQRRLGPKQ